MIAGGVGCRCRWQCIAANERLRRRIQRGQNFRIQPLQIAALQFLQLAVFIKFEIVLGQILHGLAIATEHCDIDNHHVRAG